MSEEKKVVQTTGESPQELKRGIKGWQVAFIGLGGVIGACYFLGVGWCIHALPWRSAPARCRRRPRWRCALPD